jgi:acyl-CoA thioesterase
MSDPFFALIPTSDPLHWKFKLTADVCVGPPGNVFMFGGVGLGVAIKALEDATGRRAIWATAQYLAAARPGAEVDLYLSLSVQGRRTSQARVIGRVGAEDIFIVLAALGVSGDDAVDQWTPPPKIRAPQACDRVHLWPDSKDNLNARFEIRKPPLRTGAALKDSQPRPDGRMVFWVRTLDCLVPDSGLLAVFADFVPAGVGAAFGRAGGGNSIDNTVRILGQPSTPWVLCDIQINGASRGVAHGAINLFSEDGRLVATGTQSVIVRFL